MSRVQVYVGGNLDQTATTTVTANGTVIAVGAPAEELLTGGGANTFITEIAVEGSLTSAVVPNTAVSTVAMLDFTVTY